MQSIVSKIKDTWEGKEVYYFHDVICLRQKGKPATRFVHFAQLETPGAIHRSI